MADQMSTVTSAEPFLPLDQMLLDFVKSIGSIGQHFACLLIRSQATDLIINMVHGNVRYMAPSLSESQEKAFRDCVRLCWKSVTDLENRLIEITSYVNLVKLKDLRERIENEVDEKRRKVDEQAIDDCRAEFKRLLIRTDWKEMVGLEDKMIEQKDYLMDLYTSLKQSFGTQRITQVGISRSGADRHIEDKKENTYSERLGQVQAATLGEGDNPKRESAPSKASSILSESASKTPPPQSSELEISLRQISMGNERSEMTRFIQDSLSSFASDTSSSSRGYLDEWLETDFLDWTLTLASTSENSGSQDPAQAVLSESIDVDDPFRRWMRSYIADMSPAEREVYFRGAASSRMSRKENQRKMILRRLEREGLYLSESTDNPHSPGEDQSTITIYERSARHETSLNAIRAFLTARELAVMEETEEF